MEEEDERKRIHVPGIKSAQEIWKEKITSWFYLSSYKLSRWWFIMVVKRKTRRPSSYLTELDYIMSVARNSEVARELRRLSQLNAINEIVWYGDAEPRPFWGVTLVYYPHGKTLAVYDYSEAGSYLFGKAVSHARELGVPIEVIGGGKASIPPYLVVKTLARKHPNLKIHFNEVDLAYERLLGIIKRELGRKPGDYHIDIRNRAIPVKYLLKLYNDLMGLSKR